MEQSSRAGESIDARARAVNSSAQSAALIDASVGQQFIGMERVAPAIGRMEKALSQNLVGTTALEVAARKLEELGAALRHVVQRYRI